MSLDFDTLRKTNVRRCEESFHDLDSWTPTDWACAMAGEAGEACNEVKKLRRRFGRDGWVDVPASFLQTHFPDDLKKIGHELADTVCYLDLLAARFGIDLGEAVREKFNIVSKRRGSEIRL